MAGSKPNRNPNRISEAKHPKNKKIVLYLSFVTVEIREISHNTQNNLKDRVDNNNQCVLHVLDGRAAKGKKGLTHLLGDVTKSSSSSAPSVIYDNG